MKKEKLNLSELKLISFVTSTNEILNLTPEIKGGTKGFEGDTNGFPCTGPVGKTTRDIVTDGFPCTGPVGGNDGDV